MDVAAFSTGVGYRTNLGLSLLAGLANVRLGYWWDSGVTATSQHRRVEQPSARLWRWFLRAFPVQGFLVSELVARFPGTAHRHWHLSDGGHFENMGAYELIRRRLPLILVIDAEADPAYTFEGLANLVRKARLDFQAEIVFLDAPALAKLGLGPSIDGDYARLFGPLEALPATDDGGPVLR